MAEEREMVNAGKPDILRSMRDITKEVVGQSWDIDTCNFAYELVIEAIKRTLCQNGRLMIKGFCAFELIWKDQKKYMILLNIMESLTIFRNIIS